MVQTRKAMRRGWQLRNCPGQATPMSMSIGIVWPDGRRPVAPVALGEPLPSEATISDGTHPIDLFESFIEWSGRNLLKKHRGRIGLRSGQLEFAHGRLTGGRAASISPRSARSLVPLPRTSYRARNAPGYAPIDSPRLSPNAHHLLQADGRLLLRPHSG
jgi:hypothetical protein